MNNVVKTSAEFKITYTQYLDESGQPLGSLPECASENELLVSLYQWMVKTRIFDNKAIALQRTGRLGTYPSSNGQEAIAVAIGKAMASDDVFCPYYREFGAHLQRGVAMEEIFLFWGGDERGSDFAECKEDFPHAIPIASQCLHAVGVASAFKYRQQNRAAVVTIGEGGTSEGDFYEAINLAGIWNLPIVFVVNNNQWAISVPRHAQTATETIAQKGIAAGIHCEQVDGNDALATYDLISKALSRAKTGGGATVIEAITYRLGDHTTADDAKRYREETELNHALEKEPVIRLRRYLESISLWDDKQEQLWHKEVQAEVEAAVERYESTPPQSQSAMFDYLYETLPEAYYEQREDCITHAKAQGEHK